MDELPAMVQSPEVCVFIAASLDGYIATRDHDLSWLDVVKSEGEDYGYGPFIASTDAVVLGRKTYDTIRGFGEWPFEGKKVVVFTHRTIDPMRNETQASGELKEVVARLRSEGVRRIYLDGGNLIRQGLLEGIVDTITLSVIPVLLGDGVSLFEKIGRQITLEHLSTRTYPTGLVQLRYKVTRLNRVHPDPAPA